MFRNREEAGKRLAARLADRYLGREGVVYALPRGGVPLGIEVARQLQMPVDLVIPRKIGHPGNPEYALCAVTESGDLVCNESELPMVSEDWLAEQVKMEVAEARRRRQRYLADRKPQPVTGKLAILVDDGIATGLTMRAAIRDILKRQPAHVVVAVPVIPADTHELLLQEVDDVVAVLVEPRYLGSVGSYYRDFPQLQDDEVVALLGRVA